MLRVNALICPLSLVIFPVTDRLINFRVQNFVLPLYHQVRADCVKSESI